jgi:hypothetical protein
MADESVQSAPITCRTCLLSRNGNRHAVAPLHGKPGAARVHPMAKQ